jgi:hypothetical protein
MRKFLLSVVALLALGGVALATGEDVSNYSTQGGADWEVGGTLNVKSGAVLTADVCLLPVPVTLGSGLANNQFIFVSPRAAKVEAIRARVNTAAGSAATLAVAKVAEGVAVGSAVALQSGTFNLNTASNTSVAGTLTGTQTLATGDALVFLVTGTIGSVAGVVTVCLGPQ